MGCKKLPYHLNEELRLLRENFLKVVKGNCPLQKKSGLNYYPFGMIMPGRNFSSNDYRYGFNGMEKDDEVKGGGNSLDFGARMYDSRLGKWLSIDPLAAKYPYLSPFNYVANNPIIYIDPDGKVIRLGGNSTMGLADIMSILPAGKYKSLLSVVNDEIVFNISEEEALNSNDPAVLVVYRLAQSKKVYKWTVNTNIKDGDGVGYSKTGDRWPERVVKDEKGKPITYKKTITKRSGRTKQVNAYQKERVSTQSQPSDPTVDYEREYGPNMGAEGVTDKTKLTRTETVLHEFFEMYFEGEKGLPYSTHPNLYDGPIVGSGAHNSAINVSKTLPQGDVRKGNLNGSDDIKNEPAGPKRDKIE